MVLAFRKEIVKKSPPPSSSSTFENVKYKCPFITCATIFKTTSELKRHLFRHHTDVKKDCIYLGCSYFTSNSNTLRVCYFMFSNVILTFVLFFLGFDFVVDFNCQEILFIFWWFDFDLKMFTSFRMQDYLILSQLIWVIAHEAHIHIHKRTYVLQIDTVLCVIFVVPVPIYCSIV